MKFVATKSKVHNRGVPPDSFLTELVEWGSAAPDELFEWNANSDDIYSKVQDELGPWFDVPHRRAAMLEVLRVLAGFESSWKFTEGADTSKSIGNTAENTEAGAWQMSYDARRLAPDLARLLVLNDIHDGIAFQKAIKSNHSLAMESETRLLRHTTKHNGPLYKGSERQATWPTRPKLWPDEESIFPWLSRESVEEFEKLLS